MFGKENSKTLLNQSGRSFIGESMQIEGEIRSTGAVNVAGLISGNVYVKEMIIFETGSVKGNVNAAKLIINGHMEGQIIADTVTLGSEAIIIGDISFKTSLKTEEGAEIDGYIKKIHKVAKETDRDFDEFEGRAELGKPTLVKSDKKKEVV